MSKSILQQCALNSVRRSTTKSYQLMYIFHSPINALLKYIIINFLRNTNLTQVLLPNEYIQGIYKAKAVCM